jgi:hypothetical protein
MKSCWTCSLGNSFDLLLIAVSEFSKVKPLVAEATGILFMISVDIVERGCLKEVTSD